MMGVSSTAVEQNRRILVVEDDASIREVVARYLAVAGFHVIEADDGQQAMNIINSQSIDLIVLDLLLPGMDGREICRQVRATKAIPILMLTALSDEQEKLDGFAFGADDYVTKPFSPREVVVRVQAIMRRVDVTTAPAMLLEGALHCAGVVIHPDLRRVERQGLTLELAAKEFDLLYFLARHPHQVLSRQQLLDQVWGYDFFGDASTVTVHIRRLREKIELDPAQPTHIRTVWSVGYKFEP